MSEKEKSNEKKFWGNKLREEKTRVKYNFNN